MKQKNCKSGLVALIGLLTTSVALACYVTKSVKCHDGWTETCEMTCYEYDEMAQAVVSGTFTYTNSDTWGNNILSAEWDYTGLNSTMMGTGATCSYEEKRTECNPAGTGLGVRVITTSINQTDLDYYYAYGSACDDGC